jgi:NAD(P)H-flavin reductase
MSCFGDVHPSFFGNVVKAIASAKQGYPAVSRMLERVAPAATMDDAAFLAQLNDELRATVHEVRRLTPLIVEVVVRAPLAARRFRPGQFYRLQNFESLAPRTAGTRLAMEGLALTGAWVDPKAGLISTIVLEMGGSSDLCVELKPGEPVVLMGPTGTPTEIPANETVVLAGGGLGNAVLFSIGQAMRMAGNRVLYFAAYKHMMDRYKIAEIETASDAVVWCCDEEPGFTPDRPQDKTFVGNPVRRGRPPHRHRVGPHDGRGRPGAPRCAEAFPEGAPLRARLDQFTDAVHDEGNLRAVFAAAPRSAHWEDDIRLLLLQPGPAARLCGLEGARPAAAPEFRAGEAHRRMAGSLSRRA